MHESYTLDYSTDDGLHYPVLFREYSKLKKFKRFRLVEEEEALDDSFVLLRKFDNFVENLSHYKHKFTIINMRTLGIFCDKIYKHKHTKVLRDDTSVGDSDSDSESSESADEHYGMMAIHSSDESSGGVPEGGEVYEVCSDDDNVRKYSDESGDDEGEDYYENDEETQVLKSYIITGEYDKDTEDADDAEDADDDHDSDESLNACVLKRRSSGGSVAAKRLKEGVKMSVDQLDSVFFLTSVIVTVMFRRPDVARKHMTKLIRFLVNEKRHIINIFSKKFILDIFDNAGNWVPKIREGEESFSGLQVEFYKDMVSDLETIVDKKVFDLIHTSKFMNLKISVSGKIVSPLRRCMVLVETYRELRETYVTIKSLESDGTDIRYYKGIRSFLSRLPLMILGIDNIETLRIILYKQLSDEQINSGDINLSSIKNNSSEDKDVIKVRKNEFSKYFYTTIKDLFNKKKTMLVDKIKPLLLDDIKGELSSMTQQLETSIEHRTRLDMTKAFIESTLGTYLLLIHDTTGREQFISKLRKRYAKVLKKTTEENLVSLKSLLSSRKLIMDKNKIRFTSRYKSGMEEILSFKRNYVRSLCRFRDTLITNILVKRGELQKEERIDDYVFDDFVTLYKATLPNNKMCDFTFYFKVRHELHDIAYIHETHQFNKLYGIDDLNKKEGDVDTVIVEVPIYRCTFYNRNLSISNEMERMYDMVFMNDGDKLLGYLHRHGALVPISFNCMDQDVNDFKGDVDTDVTRLTGSIISTPRNRLRLYYGDSSDTFVVGGIHKVRTADEDDVIDDTLSTREVVTLYKFMEHVRGIVAHSKSEEARLINELVANPAEVVRIWGTFSTGGGNKGGGTVSIEYQSLVNTLLNNKPDAISCEVPNYASVIATKFRNYIRRRIEDYAAHDAVVINRLAKSPEELLRIYNQFSQNISAFESVARSRIEELAPFSPLLSVLKTQVDAFGENESDSDLWLWGTIDGIGRVYLQIMDDDYCIVSKGGNELQAIWFDESKIGDRPEEQHMHIFATFNDDKRNIPAVLRKNGREIVFDFGNFSCEVVDGDYIVIYDFVGSPVLVTYDPAHKTHIVQRDGMISRVDFVPETSTELKRHYYTLVDDEPRDRDVMLFEDGSLKLISLDWDAYNNMYRSPDSTEHYSIVSESDMLAVSADFKKVRWVQYGNYEDAEDTLFMEGPSESHFGFGELGGYIIVDGQLCILDAGEDDVRHDMMLENVVEDGESTYNIYPMRVYTLVHNSRFRERVCILSKNTIFSITHNTTRFWRPFLLKDPHLEGNTLVHLGLEAPFKLLTDYVFDKIERAMKNVTTFVDNDMERDIMKPETIVYNYYDGPMTLEVLRITRFARDENGRVTTEVEDQAKVVFVTQDMFYDTRNDIYYSIYVI